MTAERHVPARKLDFDGGSAAFSLVGDIILIVTKAREWTDAGTKTFIEATGAASGDRPAKASVVEHHGVHHPPAQRKLMMEEIKKRGLPLDGATVLLSDNPITRAAMAGWVWITGMNASAFSKSTEAFDWLHQSGYAFDAAIAERELEACRALLA